MSHNSKQELITLNISIEGKKLVKDYARKKRITITTLILTLLEAEMQLEKSLSPRFD